MNCEKNTVACRDLASFAIRSVLLASGGFIATTAAAQDECTSAVTLQLNTPTAFSTLTATASTGIPLDAFCPNTSLLWTSASPDVWFKWTAPSDGLATFNTCTADTSAIDTSIALYVGSCTSLVQVGCNGDMLHNNPGGCNVTDAKVANFPVSGGVTYYIRVAGIDSEFGVSRGNGQITVTHSHISAWGDNSFNQCDLPAGITNPSKMSIGDSHALAINSTGAVVAWGSNSLGQATVPAGLTSPRDVAAGSNFSLAVRSNGTLVGWGSNTSGRATPPTTVLDATKVAAGVFHGLALRSNGAVVAWGAGMTNTGVGSAFGQAIVPSSANSGIAAIAAGNLHSLALTSQGAVIAWGAGTTDTGVTPRFGQAIVPTAAQSNVEKIAAGYYHSVALKRDGSVVCWGAGATNTGTLPHYGQSIVPAGLGVVSDIAAGRYHTVVLRANGTVTGWGLSTDYQTSIPSVTASASAVAAGGNVSFARFSPCAGGAPQTYYRDVDGDGFGTLVASVVSCTGAPAGYAPNALDCNDSLVTYVDADGDTYGAGSPAACGVASNSDCNDANAAVNPAVSEVCDAANTDENCNGVADDLDALVLDAGRTNFYVDGDNDTYTLATSARFCDQPASGYHTTVSSPLDCNDANAGVNPGRSEICDATDTDENCNGSADDLDATVLESSKFNFYRDQDNDTYTVANSTRFCDIVTSFRAQASAQVDCNDTNAAINPGATEICDAVNTDENCNSLADNADAGAADAGKSDFFADSDADTYTVASATRFCDIVSGYLAQASAQVDCNDSAAAINPGAAEICDAANTDENCNSLADNADSGAADAGKSNFFADSDADNYSVSRATRFCDIVSGFLAQASAQPDCNDTVAAINPGATEVCDAADTDENCNSSADDADSSVLESSKSDFFADADADTYTVAAATRFCDLPAGFRAAVSTLIDCNDTTAAINPGATEVCDALDTDENCNNLADNADAGAADAGKSDFFADSDADTYTVASATRFCDIVSGYLAQASAQVDCNDSAAAINPGATEVCDALDTDENCDSLADNADAGAADAGKSDFFADSDADTYTVASATRFCDIVSGYLAQASAQVDCNDSAAAINPGATEVCDALDTDENCDSLADNADAGAADAGKSDFFADSDADTYTVASATRFCDIVSGYLAQASAQVDCNDSAAAINPGATEVCDALDTDENCDSLADNADAGAADAGKSDFFADSDADTYTVASATRFCDIVSGYLAQASAQVDCNDSAAAINPGATEVCDALDTDENCDSLADNADAGAADAGKSDFFADSDADTYTVASATRFCDIVSGYLAQASAQVDCNDSAAAINPGATEVCDALDTDENCDSLADNADAGAADAGKSDFFADSDADTYTVASATRFCDIVSGYLAQASAQVDCNDSAAAINPGATEVCDALDTDENCDSLADNADAGAADAGKSDFFADSDADTYTVASATRFCDIVSGYLAQASAQVDCNDSAAAINPGATEVCDALDTDENCDSLADNADAGAADAGKSDFFADSDADTYTVASATRFCDIVSGYLAQASAQVDCNDSAAAINPGATEVCDALDTDENCDSLADNADAGAADAGKSDFFADSDADTYTVASATRFCDIVSGYLAQASTLADCDDASALTYPGAPELCSTATVDNNCDSVATDVDANAADKVDFFRDGDGDGFTSVQTSKFCSGSVQSGWLETASVQADCDDASALTFPGAVELCSTATVDNNCDSVATDVDANAADKVDFFADSDNDGYTVAQTSKFCPGTVQSGWLETASAQSDCNDSVNGINPGATEVCDAANVDENCNSVADNDDAGALESSKSDFFADSDNDGYTVATASRFCDIVTGHLAQSSGQVDCNDASNAVYPGAAELCADATIDNNCDSVATDVDANAFDKVNFFRDGDGDSYTIAQTSRFCSGTAQSGWSETASGQADCDDASASVHPGAVELCATSSVDNNCDGLSTDVDANAADKIDFFRDADLDAFTTVETSKFCSGGAPAGWAQTASAQVDCNDLDPVVNPAALEVCDLGDTDENCNGSADNADTGAQDATRSDFFVDADGDGYGAGAASRWCDNPVGYAAVSGDDCPSDPLKRVPGTCGCGVVDVDANGNGVMDCVEVGVSMTPSLTVVRPGVQFDLVIGTAQVSVPVLGLQTSIAFDPTMLEVVDAVPSGPFDTLLGLQVNNQIGRVSVAVGTFGDPVTTGGSMISIRFAVKQDSPTDCDARDRISFYTSGSVATRFSRADGRAFVPMLEPLAQLSIDGVAPSITSVPTGSAQADAGCSATVPSLVGSVVASDDCTGASGLVITQSPAAGSSLSAGSHQISFTVTDAAGNSSVLAGAFEVVGNNLDYYPDADGDGFGSSTAAAQASCSPVAGKVTDHTDCDDSSAAIHPGAAELCADSTVDNNCDGVSIDVDALAADKVAFYRDGDGDGYTSLETAQFCAGTSNAGYRSAPTNPLDCNDGDATIHPGAVENCANLGIDNDCDTIAISDEEAIDSIAYMLDSDADGFGAGPAQMSCTVVPGKVTNALDCNDGDPTINPNGIETCADMGIDNNCNGIANLDAEAIDCGSFCADLDGDGFGAGSVARACSQPSGHVPNGLDCDDTQYLYADTDGDGVGAGAPAACGVPSNTDGCPDNAQLLASVLYYADSDADGFGNAAASVSVCETTAPSGHVSDSSDCNDQALLYADADSDGHGAGAPVACGVASNDDGCPNNADLLAAVTFYRDADSDGFGTLADSIQVCQATAPLGYVTDSADCNDGAVLYADADGDGRGAGAPSACGVATNDDGCPDNAALFAAVTYYADVDADGFGNAAASVSVCEATAPAGHVSDSSDCNDGALLYADADGDGRGAGAPVACGVATNDDGCPDNAQLFAPATFYRDADNDGAGDANDATSACALPVGFVTVAGDNCPANGALLSPLTYYRDADNDGAGDPLDSIQSCESAAPAGYAATAGDGCPTDPAKTSPGTCGCGVADTDTDGDGTPNCTDGCPNDPAKTSPGTCGCGVADTDTDGDGRANCVDNCPSIANPDQLDCNSNGTGDACEIAAGTAQDCNTNGRIDSCDIASGVSTDLDASGKPDDCEFVVGGSGYGSIQAAIDFAPNGSVVKVAPGTWAPFVVNKRGLTVQAIGTREVTIVDGGAANRVVEVIGRASIRFTLRGFTIRNGRAAEGAGMLIIDADPLVENCVFTGNVASGPGGAVRATNSAADFALVVFTGNSAASGGAIANSGAALDNGALHASSCQFRQNTAATDGGAIANSGRLFLLECTLEQNTAGSLGGGLRQLETGDTTVFTSRFCMNVPDNINGAFTGVGENILSGDCNANGLCDADEIASGSVGDCNTNGIPDSCDIAGGAADCNTNGIPDSCDIASGTSGDVDANGIPDECKPDCNNNDIPDAYEIATGATPDCNTNGIPDSCDIAANTALDCNANGQLDSCEIVAGTVRDCNSNGIVDSCEIATGAADADNDGRLDRCEIVRGDLNLDGVVDAVDLATILTRWGPVSGAVAADINRDGFVDAIDLSVVLGGWGVVPNF